MRTLIISTVAVAVAAAALVAAAPAQAGPAVAASPNELETGQTLPAGRSLVSPNGEYTLEYTLTMRGDGDLVEIGLGQIVFSTRTRGHPGAYLIAQGDGNLVVRAPKTNQALWASGHRRRSPGGVTLYDTGELAQFGLDPSGFVSVAPPADLTALPAGQRLFAGQSLDSFSGNLESIDLVMQADGNLVSLVVGSPVWAAGTAQHPGAYAVMQTDGNFVVRSAAGHSLWWTGTSGNPGARLVLQPADDNLVVYSAANRPLWSIQTGRIG